MDYLKIENNQNLVRDPQTSAILNTNKTAYDKYVSTYQRLKSQNEEMNELKTNVSSLSSDIEEIKSLLKLLITEKNNDN